MGTEASCMGELIPENGIGIPTVNLYYITEQKRTAIDPEKVFMLLFQFSRSG